MRSSFIAVLALAGILLIGACSSSTEEKVKTSANSNSATASNASANSNTVVTSDGAEVAGPESADANADPNAASADLVQPGGLMRGKLENMRKSGEAGPTMDPAALARMNARPAPDNSTFTSYLTDAGYEIRTFKNHPLLLKVEKKTESDGKQTLKIFLRNGKVLELPGQRITILSTASAAYILEAAGIAPQQKQATPSSSATTKKPTGN